MPSTAAGQRRQRIEFERSSVERSRSGTRQAASWSLLGPARAKVLFGSGSERREAGVEHGTTAATFRVLASALTRSIKVQDRIAFGNMHWDVTGIAPLDTNPAEIEFTATASRG